MNMSDIKIAFFDIDGTLLRMGCSELTANMKKTLLQLQKNNIRICLATGRTLLTLPYFDGVSFDAIIAFNGSYCCAKEIEIYKNPIPSEAVHKIISNATKIGRPVALATIDEIGANGCDDDLEEYFAIAHETVPLRNDFTRFSNREVYQIMSGGRKDEYESLLQGVNGAEITAWWTRAVDIIPANGSKAIGIEKTLEYFHLSREQAIAFGDGNNDIEMLQAVGLGVAMGNSTEEVKKAADMICETVDEDGIYRFCGKYGLIEEEENEEVR